MTTVAAMAGAWFHKSSSNPLYVTVPDRWEYDALRILLLMLAAYNCYRIGMSFRRGRPNMAYVSLFFWQLVAVTISAEKLGEPLLVISFPILWCGAITTWFAMREARQQDRVFRRKLKDARAAGRKEQKRVDAHAV